MVKMAGESRALVPLSHKSENSAPLRFARRAISPAFVTQLLAIRMDADAYRARRRTDPGSAIKAYEAARALGRSAI